MAERRFALRRPIRIAVAVLTVAGWLALGAPAAATPWDEPFELSAAELLAAAAEVPRGEAVDVLFEEQVATYESDGRRTTRHRLIYRVNEAEAVEGWGTVAAAWAPWYQARPEVRARVVGGDGRELRFDPATLSEQPVASDDPAVFSDRRIVEGPLPGVAAGAVVVEEQVVRDTAPLFAAGTAGRYHFGRTVPVARERLVLDVPAGLSLRHETYLLPVEPRREEAAGRVRWTWETGPQKALEWYGDDVPGDVVAHPAVGYSVGGGWDEVGAAYARWVDERADGAELPEEVTAAVAAAVGRRAKIAAALDWLHREVRYVALALGDGGIVPRAPAETLARQYGDCKDKATLLVAVLRQAGIAADVALLATGPGTDADPDLPGLGIFDHAIVHLPADAAAGEPELWIDATVPEARVGELPSFDRGRLALVARAAGGELLLTPAAAAADNDFLLDRIVELADWGRGRLTDRTAMTGVYAMAQRPDGDEPGADGVEVEEPPHGAPAAPLVVRYPPEEAEEATTGLDAATFSMSLALLTEDLPEALLAWDESAPRRFDLEVDPFVNAVHLRVVPPPGFEPVDLPATAELVRTVGVARYERTVTVDDAGAVTLRARFDSGPARLTPEEVAATGRAVAELMVEEGQVAFTFRSRGQALLAEGRVPEAVAELRRVASSEERSAHRARLSYALLAAGLGEAARREARAAAALDPESPLAHEALGFVLLHDLFGRQLRPGWERAESEAALRRALELDDAATTPRYNLALLLEHDEHAVRYGPRSRLDEAAAEYRVLRDELGVTAYDHNLLVVLWRSGRWDEVAALAAEGTVAEAPWYAIAAAAVVDGVPAALRQAAVFGDPATRRDALSGAARLLALARRYAAAGELTAATAQGAPDAAARLSQAANLRRLVAHESVAADPATPRGALFRVLRALVLDDRAEQETLFAPARALGGLPEDEVESLRGRFAAARRGTDAGGSADLMLDSFAGGLEVVHDGSAAAGYRARFGVGDAAKLTWYLAPGADGLFLLASDEAPLASLAALARRHLDAGDLDAARLWLDWAREAGAAGIADEPWSGSALNPFWRRGEGGDETAIRRATTVLLATGAGAAPFLAGVEAAHAAATDDAERHGYERALVSGYRATGRWQELAALARHRLDETPGSDRAFLHLVEALDELGRDDEVVAVAEARLARRADDPLAHRALYQVALLGGDHAAARRHLAAAAGSGQRPNDFNELAWLAVLAGQPGDEAVDQALRAVQGASAGADSYAPLHTLATVLAELDRPLEAKDVILQALDVTSPAEPASDDWYVLGRIAESYGETDAARAAYARVEPPEDERWVPASSWSLAQRRLAALAAP